MEKPILVILTLVVCVLIAFEIVVVADMLKEDFDIVTLFVFIPLISGAIFMVSDVMLQVIKIKPKITGCKPYIYIVGFVAVIYCAFLFYLTFLKAFFNENFAVTVLVNPIGEAHFEFILFPLAITIGLWVAYDSFKNLYRVKADEI